MPTDPARSDSDTLDAPDRADPPAPLSRLRRRRDGWTAERERRFLDSLATGRTVAQAAAAAGLSTRSAYRLRRHPGGAAFARAWDRAIACAGVHLRVVLADLAALRAGEASPTDAVFAALLDRIAPPPQVAKQPPRDGVRPAHGASGL